jgi:hypothetical protein
MERYQGQYVLIKGDEVVGFFPDRDEALIAGYARFGLVPLLVNRITPDEPIHDIGHIII